MTDFRTVLQSALTTATEGLDIPELVNVADDANVFELVDSFTVVNILLESEASLEQASGRYISLADETIFDAAKSPLLKWATWLAYVEARHAG